MRCGISKAPALSEADLVPGAKTLYMRDGLAVTIVAAHVDPGERIHEGCWMLLAVLHGFPARVISVLWNGRALYVVVAAIKRSYTGVDQLHMRQRTPLHVLSFMSSPYLLRSC